MSKNLKTLILFSIWIVLIMTGMGLLRIYSGTAGEKARPENKWPKKSLIKRTSKYPALVLFLHPHCPCSIATIGELERLMPHLKDRVEVFVVIFRPKDSAPDWVKGPIFKRVSSLTDVKIFDDLGGKEALKFDSKTSGQTFLYSFDGNLVFNGGITPERGHMGDSLGREAILNYLRSNKSVIMDSDVFGCSLYKRKIEVSN